MFRLRLCSVLLLVNVITLLIMGVMAIYTTTYTTDENHYLTHQLLWVAVGLVAAGAVTLMPMDMMSKYSKYFLALVTAMLVYLVIATFVRKIFGASIRLPFVIYAKGASRWLGVGGVSIQPSEFAKLALILFLSTYYGSRDIQTIESMQEGFFKPLFVSSIVMFFVVMGKALSNTILCCLIVFTIMFMSGVKTRKLFYTAIVLGIVGFLTIMLEPYRLKRITNFISHKNTEKEWTTAAPKDNNHQLKRSIYAIGSGGLWGRGIGQGRLKNKAIPESKTDFIFAVIGEELGFVGIGFGIFLYLSFMTLCFFIGWECQERRGMLICMTVGVFVVAQAGLNLCVICGLTPTTGVTAPFVSYGGSSLVSMLLCVGLVFNVVRSSIQDKIREIVVEPVVIPVAQADEQK